MYNMMQKRHERIITRLDYLERQDSRQKKRNIKNVLRLHGKSRFQGHKLFGSHTIALQTLSLTSQIHQFCTELKQK